MLTNTFSFLWVSTVRVKNVFRLLKPKLKIFHFRLRPAAGRRPKKPRLQIQIKNDFFQTFCKIFSNIVFYALETLVRHNSILAQMLTSLVWSYSAFWLRYTLLKGRQRTANKALNRLLARFVFIFFILAVSLSSFQQGVAKSKRWIWPNQARQHLRKYRIMHN